MKRVWAALAAGILLWPHGVQAQGYSGVMAPQAGYHPPAAAAPGSPGNSSPYSGTGANDTTGYASMMHSDAADQKIDMAVQDPLPDPDDAATQRTGSAFQQYFTPKEKGLDDPDSDIGTGNSIYDNVEDNAISPTERRRRAIMRKIEADNQKAQHEIDRANQARDENMRVVIQKSVDEQRRKSHPDEADDDDSGDSSDAGADQPADQGDSGSPNPQ